MKPLNLTVDRIEDAHEQAVQELQDPEVVQRREEGSQHTESRERGLLNDEFFAVCDLPQNTEEFQFLSDHLDSIGEDVHDMYKKQFFNGALLKWLACATAAATSLPSNDLSYAAETKLSRRKIRNWLANPAVVADSGMEGYAITTDLAEIEDLLVVKVPRNPQDTLIHEYFVGMYGTNKVRESGVPNFAYMFGSFDCGSPIIEDKNLLTWCGDSNIKKTYIIYEKVPGPSMLDKLPTMTVREFMNAYVQVLLALRTAYQQIDFTHYDLHPGKTIGMLCTLLKKITPML